MSPWKCLQCHVLKCSQESRYLMPCGYRSNTEHVTEVTINTLTTPSCASHGGSLLTDTVSFIFTKRRTDTVGSAMKAQTSFWSLSCLFGFFSNVRSILLFSVDSKPIFERTAPTPLHYHQFPPTTTLEQDCSLPPRPNSDCSRAFNILIMFNIELSHPAWAQQIEKTAF